VRLIYIAYRYADCVSPYFYFELEHRCFLQYIDDLIYFRICFLYYWEFLRGTPNPDFVSIHINDRSFVQKKKERWRSSCQFRRWRRKHFHRQSIQVGLWRGNGYMQAPVIGWARGWGAWTWLMRRCVLDVIRSPKEFLRMPGLRSEVESTAKDG